MADMDPLPPPHLPPSPPDPPLLPPESPDADPPPPRAGKSVPVLAAVVVLALALAAAWFWKSRSGHRARFQAESAEERAAGLRAAFHGTGQPVSLTSPEALAIDAVFRRMLKAYEKKNASALADCFDFAGVMEMAADQNPSADLRTAARQARSDPRLAQQGALGSVQGLVKNSGHESYQIRRLEVDAGGRQAMALVVWKNAGGSRSKERYWLLRSDEWKVCDYEELDTSVRMSTSVAAAADNPSALQSGKSAAADFQKLAAAVGDGESAKARPLLLRVRKSALGTLFRDVTDVLEVNVLSQEEKPEEALALADNISQRRPDMPVVQYLRATLLSDMERHAESIAAAQKYLDILGDDPAMLNLMAGSHLALKEPDKARDCALRVLTETPPDEEALVIFGRTARPEDAAKLEELLRQSGDAEGSITSMASALEGDPPSPALAVLTGVAEKVVPGSDITASLKTTRGARELWQKVTAAGATGDEILYSALKEGSKEDADALSKSLRISLRAAQDADGLDRLSAAGTRARPESSQPRFAKAEAQTIRLRPGIESAADPEGALLEALKAADLPGSIAWDFAVAWQEAGKPDLARKAAALLKQVAPEDNMNEPLAEFLGTEAGDEKLPDPAEPPK